MRASEAFDADAQCREVDAPPLGERFDRDLVALPFDDHYGAQFDPSDITSMALTARRPAGREFRRQIEAG